MKQSTVLNVFQCLEDKGNLSPICIVFFFFFFQCAYAELFVFNMYFKSLKLWTTHSPQKLCGSPGLQQALPRLCLHIQRGPSALELPPAPRVFNLQVAFKAHLHL